MVASYLLVGCGSALRRQCAAEAVPAVTAVSTVVSMVQGMALVETVIGLGSVLSGLWQLLYHNDVWSELLG